VTRWIAALLLACCAAASSLACARRQPAPAADAAVVAAAQDEWLELAARSVVADGRRVLSVATRLRIAGARVCGGQVAPLLAVQVSQRGFADRSPPPLAEVLYRHFDVGSRPTVTLVDAGGPAAQAGIRSGDRLLRANGRRIRHERHLLRALRDHSEVAPRIELERDGERRIVSVPRVSACAFKVQLAQTDSMSSWRGSEHHGVIGRGLLPFVRSDDELAVSVAHELGHRLLGDRGSPNLATELEADRLGLAMAERAGFAVSGAPAFYERLAIELPGLVTPDAKQDADAKAPPHGWLAERIVAMRDRLSDGFEPVE